MEKKQKVRCAFPGCADPYGKIKVDDVHGPCLLTDCLCAHERNITVCHDFRAPRSSSESGHPVTNPEHYRGYGGITSIEVTEAFGLNHRLSDAVEYILRHDKKGKPVQDLCKALWWITREICKQGGEADALAAVKSSVETCKKGRVK